MRIAYIDCFSGASGDMILGALMDAGLDLEKLRHALTGLKLNHYELDVIRVEKKGIFGNQALIRIDQSHHEHHHRHLSHIKKIIQGSNLDETIKKKSIAVFTRLAEAEAHVHGTSIEAVHFHEVGAVDAIIDVVGAVVGFHMLKIDKIVCSPIHLGSGTVTCSHGILPVPAPATARLVKKCPAYITDIEGELLTPTGAAILTTLADDFGSMPPTTIENIGYGAGTAELNVPNFLRIIIGRVAPFEIARFDVERVALIQNQ